MHLAQKSIRSLPLASTVKTSTGADYLTSNQKKIEKKLEVVTWWVYSIYTMNADSYVIDPQNELSDLYTPDYREVAPNEDAYLDSAYEDRCESVCMEDYQ
jgi:hypothetical protein